MVFWVLVHIITESSWCCFWKCAKLWMQILHNGLPEILGGVLCAYLLQLWLSIPSSLCYMLQIVMFSWYEKASLLHSGMQAKTLPLQNLIPNKSYDVVVRLSECVNMTSMWKYVASQQIDIIWIHHYTPWLHTSLIRKASLLHSIVQTKTLPLHNLLCKITILFTRTQVLLCKDRKNQCMNRGFRVRR
jgi:hypothetical protein